MIIIKYAILHTWWAVADNGLASFAACTAVMTVCGVAFNIDDDFSLTSSSRKPRFTRAPESTEITGASTVV